MPQNQDPGMGMPCWGVPGPQLPGNGGVGFSGPQGQQQMGQSFGLSASTLPDWWKSASPLEPTESLGAADFNRGPRAPCVPRG